MFKLSINSSFSFPLYPLLCLDYFSILNVLPMIYFSVQLYWCFHMPAVFFFFFFCHSLFFILPIPLFNHLSSSYYYYYLKSKKKVLTFCLAMWFFWKVRIKVLPFALPHLFVCLKSKYWILTFCLTCDFFQRFGVLPFAYHVIFSKSKNRVLTFSLPLGFFFFWKVRIEFSTLILTFA